MRIAVVSAMSVDTSVRKIMNSCFAVIFTACALIPGRAVACSGEGAGEEIAFHGDMSWFSVGIVCGLLALILVSRLRRRAPNYLTAVIVLGSAVILGFHPIRTIGLYSGDCGIVTYYSSALIASVYGGLAVYEGMMLFLFKKPDTTNR